MGAAIGAALFLSDRDSMSDPVLRCDSCNKVVKRTSLHKLGACPECGNKRVRSLDVFNEDERDQITAWGFSDFLKEFEEVADA